MRSTTVKQEDPWRPGSVHKRAVATGDVRNANATHWMKTNHNMDWAAAHAVDRSYGRRGRSRTACTSGPGERTTWIEGLFYDFRKWNMSKRREFAEMCLERDTFDNVIWLNESSI